MNEPTAFQAQYPLSPRKFWKKMIDKIIFTFFIALFFGFVGMFIPLVSDPHASFSSAATFFVVTFVIIFALSISLYAWYIKTYIKRYYYDCGEQFITIKKGVFAPTEIHVQYQKIQDVYVDQDILDRIMGLYDVHIASATVTSGIEAHIDGVNAEVAEGLKDLILAKIHGASNITSPQMPSLQPQVPQSTPVQFTQKISSDTYPIGGGWVVSAIWGSLGYSILYSIILWRFLFLFGFVYVALLFAFLFFAHLIYKAIWKKNYYFEFTPDYIILRTGVISRQENHLPYKSIQNVLNKQGIVDRILGLSTVTIQNAAQQMIPSGRGQNVAVGGGISLVWQPYVKAEELNNILNTIVSNISPQNSSTMMGV